MGVIHVGAREGKETKLHAVIKRERKYVTFRRFSGEPKEREREVVKARDALKKVAVYQSQDIRRNSRREGRMGEEMRRQPTKRR